MSADDDAQDTAWMNAILRPSQPAAPAAPATRQADPANTSAAPAEYATPQQIASLRAYGHALMMPKSVITQGGQTIQTQPTLYKPWQGLGMVANSMIGGYFSGQADRMERAANNQGRALTIPSISTAASTPSTGPDSTSSGK